MTIASTTTCRPIVDRLTRLRRSLAMCIWIDGLSRLVIWAVMIGFADLAIDRFFRLDRAQRGIMLAVMAIALAVVAWRRLIRPLTQSVSDDLLLARIERANRQLNQSLISAVQFARWDSPQSMGLSPQLVGQTIQQGVESAGQADFDRVINYRQRNRNLLRGGAAAGLMVLAFMLFPGTMALWFQRNLAIGEQTWPQRTHLHVVGAERRRLVVPRGDDLQLQIRTEGVVPDAVYLDYRIDSGRRATEQMTSIGKGLFRLKFNNVLDPMVLRARGGDGQTPWVDVELVDRPRVEELALHITPPDYTNQPRRQLESGEGSYYVPAGGTLEIAGRANKPLSSAGLMIGRDPLGALVRHPDDPTRFGRTLGPSDLRSGVYAIELRDTEPPDGLLSRRPMRFSLRVMPDQPPTARAELIGIGDLVLAGAVVPMRCQFTDDYAVADARLLWRIDEPGQPSDPEGNQARRFDELADQFGQKRIEDFEYRMELSELDPPLGAHVTFFVEATDSNTYTGPGRGKSSSFSLKVVSEQELREELLRREQEQRMETERLLSDQRALLVDTRALQAGLGDGDQLSAEAYRQLVNLEKTQRLASGRCAGIARQFERIIAEVTNNRLEDVDGPIHQRLEAQVVGPLKQLAETDIPQAADALDLARTTTASAAQRDQLLTDAVMRQRAVVAVMEQVLQNMVKMEGYQQAINLLRQIVKAQAQVNEQTVRELEKKIQSIFDD